MVGLHFIPFRGYSLSLGGSSLWFPWFRYFRRSIVRRSFVDNRYSSIELLWVANAKQAEIRHHHVTCCRCGPLDRFVREKDSVLYVVKTLVWLIQMADDRREVTRRNASCLPLLMLWYMPQPFPFSSPFRKVTHASVCVYYSRSNGSVPKIFH